MKPTARGFVIAGIVLLVTMVFGQAIAYLVAPESWRAFASRLPVILAMIAFWGPISALLAGLFVWMILRLLGFDSIEEIRVESVEQNNPTPAIVFVGTLIASILFLMLVIRP
jgi:ABC-type spermidine/putrescine transport system permease subunit I